MFARISDKRSRVALFVGVMFLASCAGERTGLIEDLQRRKVEEGWTFEVGHNEMMDLPLELATGLLPEPADASRRGSYSAFIDLGEASLPRKFDLREINAVTDVKNQGACGSCWAFAATASAESAIAYKTGQKLDLSEQAIVSCGSFGSCAGGSPSAITNYVTKNAVYEVDFPYTASNKPCPSNIDTVRKVPRAAAGIDLRTTTLNGNVDSIKYAVYNYGAVATSLLVDSSFGGYKSGIFNNCKITSGAGHMVTIVGWDDDQESWIIKNSWGKGWGEAGFGRIKYRCNGIGAEGRTLVYQTAGPSAPPSPWKITRYRATSNSITLRWTASTGATQYRIERSASISGFQKAGVTSATEFTDAGLGADSLYSYRVIAINQQGESKPSAPVVALTHAPVVRAVPRAEVSFSTLGADLSAQVGFLRVGFQPQLAGGTYILYRRKPGVDWAVADMFSASIGVSNLDSHGLIRNYFQILLDRSYTQYRIDFRGGSSVVTGEVLDYSAPPKVSFKNAEELFPLAKTGPGADITLTWRVMSGAVKYEVFRSLSPAGPHVQLGSVATPQSSWLDTSATRGEVYYYSVRAVSGQGEISPLHTALPVRVVP